MKNERIIFGIIILILLGLWGASKLKSNEELRGLQTMVEVLNDTVKVSKNREGKLVAEKRSQFITIKELQKHGQELNIDKKGLKKQVGNLNNLVAYYKGKAATSGSGSVVLTPDLTSPADTTGASPTDTSLFPRHFVWDNTYLSLTGSLSTDYKLDFTYKYRFDYEVVTYWKKKDLVINVTFSDPNLVTTDINSIVIKPQPKKFYQTNWFWGGLGFLGGFVLGTR